MLRRVKTDLIVLLGYAAVSFGYFSWRLLPHPGRSILGVGHDPEIMIWSFGWWAHALTHWTNPFVSHMVYAATGVNLTWAPAVAGLAVVFTPVTLLAGPVASFNLAALLLPALAAWTAYLLCRRLTGSVWGSLVGGYLFGFSTAMLRQQISGHLHMTAVFLIPLVALVVLKYLEGEIKGRGLAWRLGILLAAQLWISTELALTVTIVLVLGLGLAYLLVSDIRSRARTSLVPIAAGYVLGGLLAAPFILFTLLGFVSTRVTADYRVWGGTDLAHFVVPNRVIGIGGSSFSSVVAHMPSGESAYLGLPTLLIVILFAVRARRSPWARFLVAGLVVTATIALGVTLQVDGHVLLTLPWWEVGAHLPALDDAIPFRFSTYVSLAAAVIVARWIATTKGLVFSRPYVLPVLAVAALVPAVWQSSDDSFAPSHPDRPAFFADGLYKSCIPRGETVLVFPFGGGGDSLLWQAESGFRFNLAANGIQPYPKIGAPLSAFDTNQFVWDLTFVDYGRPTITRLRAFAATHDVDRVITVRGADYPSPLQMQAIGPTQRIGGVLVSPACGHAPLAKSSLAGDIRAAGSEQLTSSRPNIGYCIGLTFNEIPQGIEPAGLLKGAHRAIVVAGQGLTCGSAPPGYKRHGFASPALHVPPDTYAYYAP